MSVPATPLFVHLVMLIERTPRAAVALVEFALRLLPLTSGDIRVVFADEIYRLVPLTVRAHFHGRWSLPPAGGAPEIPLETCVTHLMHVMQHADTSDARAALAALYDSAVRSHFPATRKRPASPTLASPPPSQRACRDYSVGQYVTYCDNNGENWTPGVITAVRDSQLEICSRQTELTDAQPLEFDEPERVLVSLIHAAWRVRSPDPDDDL